MSTVTPKHHPTHCLTLVSSCLKLHSLSQHEVSVPQQLYISNKKCTRLQIWISVFLECAHHYHFYELQTFLSIHLLFQFISFPKLNPLRHMLYNQAYIVLRVAVNTVHFDIRNPWVKSEKGLFFYFCNHRS